MLVTKEQAIKLKKLNYDREVFTIYEDKLGDRVIDCSRRNYNQYNNDISAPTVSEALDFMREEKGIMCYVEMPHHQIKGDNRRYIETYQGVIVKSLVENYTETERFSLHTEASLALLDAVIKYIEENECKNM